MKILLIFTRRLAFSALRDVSSDFSFACLSFFLCVGETTKLFFIFARLNELLHLFYFICKFLSDFVIFLLILFCNSWRVWNERKIEVLLI